MECYNYIHPFSIGSTCRPHRVLPMRHHSRSFVVQTFVEDLTISCPSDVVGVPHRVAAFDDLSALDVSPTFCTHLIRGCPYVTLTTAQGAGAVDVVVASVHAFMEVASCNQHATKWHLRMNSGQTFLLYASASIRLAQTDNTHLSALGFAGVIRVAYLPDTSMEPVLDRYSRCFPTSGEAALNQPFCPKLHRYFTEVPHPYRDTYSILRYIDTFSIPYQRRIKNTIQ
jgi:endo-1,3(4)-beta-glucanase